MSFVGTDQIEGTDVYKLKVTLASNGDVRTYYLDAESCVPIKYEVKRTVRGAERWFEVELGDYKEVQGVLFPFSMATGRQRKLERGQAAVLVGTHHGEPRHRGAAVRQAGARGESRHGGQRRAIGNGWAEPRVIARAVTRAARQLARGTSPSSPTPRPSPDSARATSARPR